MEILNLCKFILPTLLCQNGQKVTRGLKPEGANKIVKFANIHSQNHFVAPTKSDLRNFPSYCEDSGDKKYSKEKGFQEYVLDQVWHNRTYKQFLKRSELYKPLFLILFLTIIQRFSGMTVLRTYGVKIFNNIFNDDPW